MGVTDVVATVVLLRYYLTPAEYGIASIATTLYPMFDLLADAGVSAAVVQHDELDEERASTAWWVSAATSVGMAVALCGLGPLLAFVQGQWIVAGLIAAYGVKLLLQNAYFLPVAMLRRDLQFKLLAKIRTLGSIAEGLYRAAYELVLEPAKLLSYIVVDVAFPVFSRLRADMLAMRAQLVAFTRHNVIVLAPFIAAMMLVPEDLLAVAYGDAWRTAGDAARILAVVAALRALSYLLPPLLDATGRVDLTLRYTLAAAIVVPSVQVFAAVVLGDRVGWISVAIGWAVAYPLAFVLLVAFALREVRLSLGRYTTAIVEPGITALLAYAVALPVAAHLDGAWLRLIAIGSTILVVHIGALAIMRARAPRMS